MNTETIEEVTDFDLFIEAMEVEQTIHSETVKMFLGKGVKMKKNDKVFRRNRKSKRNVKRGN